LLNRRVARLGIADLNLVNLKRPEFIMLLGGEAGGLM
jgi:hypothetical protein